MGFKDHFSGHAQIYAAARPDYPPALFDFLAGLCRRRQLAWDSGTGRGQAALGLVRHFTRVIATDASQAQLDAATPHERISYRCQAAEQLLAEAGQVDLVTIAQALHWLDTGQVYEQVDKALAPQGVLAVWCYGVAEISPAIDAVIQDLYQRLLGEFWPPERVHVENGYRDLAFPYPKIAVPAFYLEQHWTLEQQVAYLYSWSATQRYIKAHGRDPVMLVTDQLRDVWHQASASAESPSRQVRWPMTLLAGRKPDP